MNKKFPIEKLNISRSFAVLYLKIATPFYSIKCNPNTEVVQESTLSPSTYSVLKLTSPEEQQ